MARPATPLALVVALGLALATCAAARCSGTKAYAFTVDMNWNTDEDPDMPPNAEITKVVAVAHKRDSAPWEEGGHASDALAELVHKGSADAFENLLSDQKDEGLVSDYEFAGKDRNGPTSSVRFELTLDGDKNATFVTVLAGLQPSPGWFIARARFPLCDGLEEEYLETNDVEPELLGYDSGVSEGDSYNDAFKMKESKTDIASLRNGVKYGTLITRRESGAKGSARNSKIIGIALGAGLFLVAAVVAAVLLLRRRKSASTGLMPSDVMEEGEGDVDW